MSNDYLFKSTRFQIEPGEDNETNPRRYGRQLAHWLKSEFEKKGYPVEDVIAEDWGWCVMCQREPFLLWVGCGNQDDSLTTSESDPPPKSSDVIWQCFTFVEVPFFKRVFKKINTDQSLAKLDSVLSQILKSENSIQFIEHA